MIQDNNVFIKQHMNQTTPVLMRDYDYISHSDFTETASRHPWNWFGKHRGFFVHGVSEGLVLENDILDKFIVVRNPATCKILDLPHPSGDDIYGMWFDFDSSTGEANLLCKTEQGYEILKSGEEKWRALGQEFWKCLIISRDKKKMFFVGHGDIVPDSDIHVSSFDIRTGRCVSINNFPRDLFSDLSKLIPMWLNNCLAFADLAEKNLRVMVLEEQEEENNKCYKWSEKKVIASSGFLQYLISNGRVIPLEVISDDLWLINSDRKHKCRYDIKEGKVVETRVLDTMKTFEYRPSLRRLEGMKPAKFGHLEVLQRPIRFSISLMVVLNASSSNF